jgi:hypothetical protein
MGSKRTVIVTESMQIVCICDKHKENVWDTINVHEPSMILCAKCTCIIGTRSMSNSSTSKIHPTLDADVGAIILSGQIRMKVPINVGDAHEELHRQW